MKSIGKVMLGAALAVGAMGLAAVPAHAAHIRIGVAIGGPVAYAPPYPGPGYVWVNGYWADGAWMPGYWNYAGVAPEVGYYYGAPGYYREPGYYHDRDWDHDRDWHRDHDWDHDRGWHGDHDGDHDHDRGEHRFRR